MKTPPSFRILAWPILAALMITPVQAHIAADEMATAANKFLAALDEGQKAKAIFDFKSDERGNWHFIPKDRLGLKIKEMTEPQRQLAHVLLRSAMSDHGYGKVTNIMSLEPVLAQLEGAGRSFPRDQELYHFFIFGKPGSKETWGWRVEGHHVSVNVTVTKGEEVSVTPSFLGSNPAEVRQGPRKGFRVLAEEEDTARTLVKSFDEEQRKAAIVEATAPKEIFTTNQRKVKPLPANGISSAKLTKEQSDLLLKVIKAYVYRYRPEIAQDDLKKIDKAGLDKIQFAWYGGIEKGEGHYYRVQGPTFLMEYDNTQNNNNHIHAVWRDFEGDFGEDLLRKHYETTPHP